VKFLPVKDKELAKIMIASKNGHVFGSTFKNRQRKSPMKAQ
jgi:hypothetical protein